MNTPHRNLQPKIKIMHHGNLFSGIPGFRSTSTPATPATAERGCDELIDILLTSPNTRIERIVSHGHASPDGFWYDQDQHEWVVVLKGAARLGFEDGIVEMIAGSFIDIPAHKKHRVEWTTPDESTVWLAVHYGGGRRPEASREQTTIG